MAVNHAYGASTNDGFWPLGDCQNHLSPANLAAARMVTAFNQSSRAIAGTQMLVR